MESPQHTVAQRPPVRKGKEEQSEKKVCNTSVLALVTQQLPFPKTHPRLSFGKISKTELENPFF